jgi:hypothetical protein
MRQHRERAVVRGRETPTKHPWLSPAPDEAHWKTGSAFAGQSSNARVSVYLMMK